MSMTKKDYELVARSLDMPSCELMNAGVYELVVNALATAFEQDNDKFNKDKFLKGCGL